MSEEVCCGDCGFSYFVKELEMGDCRRYPPVYINNKTEWSFPQVFNDERCGEYVAPFLQL